MRKLLFIVLIAAAGAFAPAAAHSQTRADTAAVLLQAASQLESQNQTSAARALLELIRARYGGTAAADSAANRLSLVTRDVAEESGRVELMVFGTTYGLWLGIAVPVMMDAKDLPAYGAGLLVGAPLGFLTARQYTKSQPALTIGQARAITFGGTWGTWQGGGWMHVIGESTYCYDDGGCYEEGPSGRNTVGAMVAGSVAGLGVGTLLARKPISSGVATTVSLSGFWGTWFGLSIGSLADLRDDDLLAAMLTGGDAAIGATAFLAPKWNFSRNRARLISLAGIVGGVAGGGINLIVQPEEDIIAGIPLVTSIIGLGLGAYATRDYDAMTTPRPERGGEALLNKDAAGWHIGSIEPYPTLLRDDRKAERRIEPALGVTLFRATFQESP